MLKILDSFLSIGESIYFLHIISQVLIILSALVFFKNFNNRYSLVILAVVIIKFSNFRTWGGYDFVDDIFVPSYLGFALVILFIALISRNLHLPSLITLISISYIHVSIGFWINLIMLIYLATLFLQKSKQFSIMLKLQLANLIFTSPVYLNQAIIKFQEKSNVDIDYTYLVTVRAPHHFIFGNFTNDEKYKTFFLLLFLIVSIIFMSLRAKYIFVVVFVVSNILFAIVSIILSERNLFYEIQILYPFKLFPILIPIAIYLLLQNIQDKNINLYLRIMFVIPISLLLCNDVFHFRSSIFDVEIRNVSFSSIIIYSLIIIMIFLALILNYKDSTILMCAILMIQILWTISRLDYRRNIFVADSHGVYKQIYELSSTGDIFLIPPEMAEFRFYSRRAVVVDWKYGPIGNGALVNEWVKRNKDLQDYNNLSFQTLKDKCLKYKCNYIVLTSDNVDFDLVQENTVIQESEIKIIKSDLN